MSKRINAEEMITTLEVTIAGLEAIKKSMGVFARLPLVVQCVYVICVMSPNGVATTLEVVDELFRENPEIGDMDAHDLIARAVAADYIFATTYPAHTLLSVSEPWLTELNPLRVAIKEGVEALAK